AAGPSIMMLYFGPYHGRQYPGVDVALVLLVGLQLINAARYNCAIVIVALGKAGIGAKAKAISVVVNLGLTIALVFPFGLNGVLVGTMVASAVQNVFLMRRYTRLLAASVRDVLWSWYLPGLFAMAIAVGFGRLAGFAISTSPPVSRGAALPVVLVSLAGFSLAFAGMLRAVRYLSRADLGYFSRILPGPLGKLPKLRIAQLLVRTES
ncbi:MAG: polysaccharide biosynthesis C-terminal domain-containing protein, partial [Actinomycetota bacterium]